MSLFDMYRKWRGMPTDAELEAFILANLPAGTERTTLYFFDGIEKNWPRGIPISRLYSKLDDLEEDGIVKSRRGIPTPERGNRAPILWRLGGGTRVRKPVHQRRWLGIPQTA